MSEETGRIARFGAPRAQRYAAGKSLRMKLPREAHADGPSDETRDPIAILKGTDAARIPALLPICYERMAKSSFAFLRGAASVMASDLARLPPLGAHVQACGDCHLMNFGVFSTPEGQVLFDINDFDETSPGVDFTVDLKRLVASVAVAAREAQASDRKAKALAQATAKAYREFVPELARKSPLEVWHTRMAIKREVTQIDGAKLRDRLLSILIKAKKDLAADDNFPHLAAAHGGPRIQDRPPLIYHFHADDDAERAQKIRAHAAFSSYRRSLLPERSALAGRYALRDIAMKVVGVGSVGTFCAIGLFMSADDEPLFLQIKQALPSALATIAPAAELPAHQGRRVAEGQRALQAASDLFLGWTEDEKTGREFYVRQLKNRRLGSIGEVIAAKALDNYAILCARTLARAHARTGDPALLAGYMGRSETLDEALAAFAMAYAEQTDRDHAALVAARNSNTGLP